MAQSYPGSGATRENVARIIDPDAFKSWQSLFDYTSRSEAPEFSKRCADHFYGDAVVKAFAKAQAVLALSFILPSHDEGESLEYYNKCSKEWLAQQCVRHEAARAERDLEIEGLVKTLNGLEKRQADGCFDMLWAWFTERRGADDMRANAADGGLSADDFKQMLDEHELNLMPGSGPGITVPAQGVTDPDAQNERRYQEDCRLAHNARLAAIKECADNLAAWYPDNANTNAFCAALRSMTRATEVSSTHSRCGKCGCETKGESALVNGEVWCHPCADSVPSTDRGGE